MGDEPTNGGVCGAIRRGVLVRNGWRAISFVGHLRLLVRYPGPRPTGINKDQGNQGQNNNRSKSTKDDDRYEPRPKALTDLENPSPSHGWSSECLPEKRSGSRECKRVCGRDCKVSQKWC